MADIMPDVQEEVVTQESSPESNKESYLGVDEPRAEVETAKEEAAPEQDNEKHIDKKGAEYRIRELNEKAKAAEAKADSLAKQIEQLTTNSQPQQSWDQLNQPLPTDESGQVDAAEFEKRILAKAQAIAELQTARTQHIERVNREAAKVMEEYSVLNPDSDSYDPELSDSVAKASLAFVRQNPTDSLKKFVDGLMKPYTRSISKQVGGMQEIITKQAAETALRPSSAPKSEKRFEDLSLKEMEERLGKVY